MLAAINIAVKKHKLVEGDREFFVKMMEKFSLPTSTKVDADAVYLATFNDKKMESGKLKFILLNSIGEAYIDREVSKNDIMEALEHICKKI